MNEPINNLKTTPHDTLSPEPILSVALDGRETFGAEEKGPRIEGPHRFIKVGEKTGFLPTSLQSSCSVQTEVLRGEIGTLELMVCPMEALRKAAIREWMIDKPSTWIYPILADGFPGNRKENTCFAWYWQFRWYPAIVAKFCAGAEDYDFIAPPVAFVEAFELEAFEWYHFCLTWDFKKCEMDIFINGLNWGRLYRKFEQRDTPSDRLYIGNTAMASADVRAYPQRVTHAEAFSLFERQERFVSDKILRKNRADYTPKSAVDKLPERGPGWHLAYENSFTKPGDTDGWVQEGCLEEETKLVHNEITPEGWLLETPDFIHNDSRVFFWSPESFEGDLHVSFEFRGEKDNGLALLVTHGNGLQREDIIHDHPARSTGAMTTIIGDAIRNYHWEFFRRYPVLRNDADSQFLVKNPWCWDLAYLHIPRLELHEWHRLDFRKEGKSLIGAINGKVIIDATDNHDTNSGADLNCGRIAIRLMYQTRMRFRNLEVWTGHTGLEIVSEKKKETKG